MTSQPNSNVSRIITNTEGIPSATYRFIDMKDGKAIVTDFIAETGETKDLGRFVLESNE